MSSKEEVLTIVGIYTSICIIFFIIFILTGNPRLAVDFILRLNETGHINI